MNIRTRVAISLTLIARPAIATKTPVRVCVSGVPTAEAAAAACGAPYSQTHPRRDRAAIAFVAIGGAAVPGPGNGTAKRKAGETEKKARTIKEKYKRRPYDTKRASECEKERERERASEKAGLMGCL